MPPIEQHRRSAIRCRQLQPAGRCHIGGFDFGDHAGERAIAQAILGHCQNLRVLVPLGIENTLGTKADLLQPRRVEIEFRERPQYRMTRSDREPCGDARCEQRRGSVIVQAAGSSGDFVKAGTIETMIGKPLVQSGDTKRERRSARFRYARQFGAERRAMLGW